MVNFFSKVIHLFLFGFGIVLTSRGETLTNELTGLSLLLISSVCLTILYEKK